MFESQPGVTDSIPSSQEGTSDFSPESPTLDNSTDESKHSSDSQPGSKEYNFKQMRENQRRLEEERKQWESEKKSLQGAALLDQQLKKDPRTGLKFLAQSLGVDLRELIDDLSANGNNKTQAEIDLDGYDEHTTKLLKDLYDRTSKVEQLEKWKEEFEQQQLKTREQQEIERIQNNMSTIDSDFDSALIKDGFMDKDGQGNDSVIRLIRNAVISELASVIDDPRLASREQFHEAYKTVVNLLSAHKNQTLKNTVTKSIPASGSRNGQATTAKPAMTREQRIAELANAAQSMFGME